MGLAKTIQVFVYSFFQIDLIRVLVWYVQIDQGTAEILIVASLLDQVNIREIYFFW
jgi:hypothetical protein